MTPTTPKSKKIAPHTTKNVTSYVDIVIIILTKGPKVAVNENCQSAFIQNKKAVIAMTKSNLNSLTSA